MTTPHFTHWTKSTRSGSAGDNCVEVATATNTIGVRDSKSPDDAVLTLTHEAWLSFTADLKSGHYDVR